MVLCPVVGVLHNNVPCVIAHGPALKQYPNLTSRASHTDAPPPNHSNTAILPQPNATATMSSTIGRAAFRATRPLYRPAGVNSGQGADSKPSTDALRSGAKRDPELYVRPLCTPVEVPG